MAKNSKTSSDNHLVSNISTRIVRVTPEMARRFLEMNVNNRPLRASRVARYAEDITNGRWQLNGETIIFSDAGEMLNGQHRMHAVVKAGVPADFMIVENVAKNAYKTMDAGMTRTAGDILRQRGVANASAVAAMMRIALNYRDGKSITEVRTNAEIEEAIQGEPSIIQFANEHQQLTKTTRSTVTAALCWIVHRFGPQAHRSLVEDFIIGVTTGINLSENDPRRIFREKLIRLYGDAGRRPEAGVVWHYAQRSLAHYIRGNEVSKLQLSKNASVDRFSEIASVPRITVQDRWHY